jgi:predicted alpha/beta superfamily hydrolase
MRNRSRILFIGLVITFVHFYGTVLAQELPGKRDSLHSTILNEKRVIQVVLPEKYKPGSKEKYDVLYVLDGDWNTKLAVDMQHFIEGEAYMPPTIIVGVLNVDRDRDLTPIHVPQPQTSGGADKFLGFLRDELIPYINKTYPSNGDNAIFGHSLGGLFVMYTLLNQPQVFKSYIAADPSFWFNHNYMNKMAAEKLPGLANLNRTLYISGREGMAYKGMGIVAMDSIIKAHAPADLLWKSMAYPDETHGSVRLKSMYDGLKFTYSGFMTKNVELHPMNGILLKDKPTLVWVVSDYSAVHYTTDGSEPTLASPKWSDEVWITGPAKLSVKSFGNRGSYDKTVIGEFKLGKTLPPKADSGKFKHGGFKYAYYEGQFDKLPDFKKLTPIQTGITDKGFEINKLPHQKNFALLITGELEITKDGYYLFGLDANDGSKIYLGNQLLMTYDSLLTKGKTQSYVLPLAKGFYPIRIEYFKKDSGQNLNLIYLLPDSKQPHAFPIPLKLQYSQN